MILREDSFTLDQDDGQLNSNREFIRINWDSTEPNFTVLNSPIYSETDLCMYYVHILVERMIKKCGTLDWEA